MALNNLESSITYWINLLGKYSLEQLTHKYRNDKWSLGQVFIHLIESSNHFLSNAEDCLNNPKNHNEKTSESAEKIFRENELPNIEIKGPQSNNLTQQPISVNSIEAELVNLKNIAHRLREKLDASHHSGKTKHPGLGYFDAIQWFQFTDIHFRHHQRQLVKIESTLQNKFSNS